MGPTSSTATLSSRTTRHHLVNCRRRCGLLVWIMLGLASYASVWMVLLSDDRQSYTAVTSLHQTRLQAESKRRELEQKRREQKQTNVRQRKSQANKQKSANGDAGGDGTFFDWSFWGLCMCFSLMSYVRIRLEPSRRQRRRRREAASIMMALNNDGTTNSTISNTTEETQRAVMLTLRRINRDRERRGETPVTLDAYQALRMALLQDRTLLRGLAGHRVPPPARGATPEQLETCQQLTIAEEDDYEGDCCICLAPFQTNDQIRILPCSHSYHRGCIDHWFQQSRLCPICKHSLDHADDQEEGRQSS